MRLADMARALIEGRPKRGLGMEVVLMPDGSRYLGYQSGKMLAEIVNPQADGSFTLRIHQPHYGSISYRNRIGAVLSEAGRKADNNARYVPCRYYAVCVYGTSYIYDYRLRAYYAIRINDSNMLTFHVSADREVTIDYDHLERRLGDSPAPTPKPVSNNANLSSKEEITELLAIATNL